MESCIVVKVTKEYIVLLSPDGSFRNVRHTGTEIPLIGEKYTINGRIHSTLFPFRIAVAAVACVLFLTVLSYRMFMTGNSKAYYFTALDINPSIEIYSDKGLSTTRIDALNEDGKKLTGSNNYNGKSLYDTVEAIIVQSIESGYLKQGREEYIKITFVPLQKAAEINENSIKDSLQEQLAENNIDAELEVGSESKNIVEEAHLTGLSVNRYILYKRLIQKGVSVTVEESKNMPLEELKNYETVQEKNIAGQTEPQKSTGKNEVSDTFDNNGKSENNGKNLSEAVQSSKTPVNSNSSGIKNNGTRKNSTDKAGVTGNTDKKGTVKPVISVTPRTIGEENKFGNSSTENGSTGSGNNGSVSTENSNAGNSSNGSSNAGSSSTENSNTGNGSTGNSNIESGSTDKSNSGSSNTESNSTDSINSGSGNTERSGTESNNPVNGGSAPAPSDRNLQTGESPSAEPATSNKNGNTNESSDENIVQPAATDNKTTQTSGNTSGNFKKQ